MRKLFLLLMMAAPAWGASLAVTSDSGSFTIPSTSPFTSMTNMRIEMYLDVTNLDCTGSDANLWKMGGFAIRCYSGNPNILSVNNPNGGNSTGGPNYTTRTLMFVRAQYEGDGSLTGQPGYAWIEAWDATDGSYFGRNRRIGTHSSAFNVSGSQTVLGGGSLTYDIAWVRMYNTLVPLGTGPSEDLGTHPSRTNRATPNNVVSDSPLGEWNFENVLTDSGPHGMTLADAGAAYVSTPSMNPIARIEKVGQPFWQLDPVCRQDNACNLTAAKSITGHISDATLTYSWSYISGITGSFSATDVVAPNWTCSGFGQSILEVEITDQNANTDTLQQAVGCVETDDNGIVIYPSYTSPHADPIRFLLGDRLMFGLAPWPAIDKIYLDMAENYGGQQTTNVDRYGDNWNSLQSSTVTLNTGTTVIDCDDAGCDFQDVICGGDANAGGDATIVVYPQTGSFAGRKIYINLPTSNACPSATALNTSTAYTGPTESGVQWAPWGEEDMVPPSCLGCMINGSDNNNYYSNVRSFYGLYFITGLTKYRDFARTLAGWWWDMPPIDKGLCVGGGMTLCLGPKEIDLSGLFLYWVESGEDMADGLELLCDNDIADPTNDERDIREDGYRLAGAGACAALHTDAGKRATWEAAIDGALDAAGRWGSAQITSGLGTGAYPSCYQGDFSGDTVTVTNGSPTVSYTAGTCTSSCTDWVMFRVSGDRCAPGLGPAYSVATYSHPTMTLDTAYQGTSSPPSLLPHTNILVGSGVQPWQTQPGVGLMRAHELGNSDALAQLLAYVEFTFTVGVDATDRGFYNARLMPQCETGDAGLQTGPDIAGTNCNFGTESSRYIGLESLEVLAIGLKYSRGVDQTLYDALLVVADDLLAAGFGAYEGLGGPGTIDSVFLDEFTESSTLTFEKPKNFGFAFGFSNMYTLLAERLGGLQQGAGASGLTLDFPITITNGRIGEVP